jgi:hypothetical protein
VPSLAPLSTSTCWLLASGFFSLFSGFGAGGFGVEPGCWTGGVGAELSFTGLLVRNSFHHSRILRVIVLAEYHHRGILRLMCAQLTAIIDTSATRYVIKDTTTVVILYSRVVWSTSFWNIVMPNTVLEKVRWNFGGRMS